VVSPQYLASLNAGDVSVTVQVSGFNLVDKIGQANVPGEGHIIYYLDIVPPVIPKATATTKPNTFIASASTSNLWKNISGGQHSLMAQLVNNDNTPLNPPVVDGAIVNVKTGKSVTIDLIAQNISYNLNVITVPAGAQVTINFTNNDLGIPHNIDIYQSGRSGRGGGFTGHSITGVSSIVYQFTAPVESGTYHFQCDFHPLQMFGSFIVTQP
jgi:plastocyanin